MTTLGQHGLGVRDVGGDGACAFRAASFAVTGNEASHLELRETTANFMQAHMETYIDEAGGETQEAFAARIERLRLVCCVPRCCLVCLCGKLMHSFDAFVSWLCWSAWRMGGSLRAGGSCRGFESAIHHIRASCY